jgi:hypothetical protein
MKWMEEPQSVVEYEAAAARLASYGPAVVDHLVDWLSDSSSSWKRIVGIQAAVRLGPRYVPEGLRLIRDPDVSVDAKSALVVCLFEYDELPEVQLLLREILDGGPSSLQKAVKAGMKISELKKSNRE